MKPLDHSQAVPPGHASRVAVAGCKATLLLVSALTIMSGATISPSLPAIEARFAATENVALLTRLVLTMPALFIALCAPLAGGIADRFGRRSLLLGAVLVYGLAGMSGLVLDTLGGILVGRALLGLAVAGTMTTATALIGDYFAGAERDRFMGLQAAFIGFGGIVFLTGGGVLAEFHWRAPFAVYGLAVALIPAIAAFLAEPPSAARQLDATGEEPIAAPWVAITAVFAVAVLNSVAFYLVPTQLPFHLEALGSGTPSRAGLAIGLVPLLSAVTALAYGRVRSHLGIASVFGLGLGLMAVGFGLTALVKPYAAVLAAMSVIGLGMGLVMPNLAAAAMTVAPPALRGRVAGGLTASIFLGQFLSPLVSQPWIGSFGFAAAFRDAGLVLAAVAAVAFSVAIVGARRSPAAADTTTASRRAPGR